MGSQYKKLTIKDIDFIKKQKIFYIASCSNKEVNLSPKGYDCLRVIDDSNVVMLSYAGSGNRTYRDTKEQGEFTLLFNAFCDRANILRLFCKCEVIKNKSDSFYKYLSLFNENEQIVRNLFHFKIYAVESSCGTSVPYMKYEKDRNELKQWNINMNEKNKLKEYIQKHKTPPNL